MMKMKCIVLLLVRSALCCTQSDVLHCDEDGLLLQRNAKPSWRDNKTGELLHDVDAARWCHSDRYIEGQEVQCRTNAAISAGCPHNPSAGCRGDIAGQGFACAPADIARRAGHVCDTFPGWAGGWPIGKPPVWNPLPTVTQECVLSGDGTGAALSYCPRWLSFTQPGPRHPIPEYACPRKHTKEVRNGGCAIGSDWWVVQDCKCSEARTSSKTGSQYCGSWSCDELYVDQTSGDDKDSESTCLKIQPLSEVTGAQKYVEFASHPMRVNKTWPQTSIPADWR